jgi:hypothetical protein
MRIVALDPGGTTGLAFFERSSAGDEGAWSHQQLAGEHHLGLYSKLVELHPEVVIYERFMYQRRELDKGVSLVLDSVEYIGVTKLYHAVNVETVDLICQTPAQAKNLWTDDKLKKLGLYIPGAPHAMDATRHLLYYLVVTRGERDWIMRLKPPISPDAAGS